MTCARKMQKKTSFPFKHGASSHRIGRRGLRLEGQSFPCFSFPPSHAGHRYEVITLARYHAIAHPHFVTFLMRQRQAFSCRKTASPQKKSPPLCIFLPKYLAVSVKFCNFAARFCVKEDYYAKKTNQTTRISLGDAATLTNGR